MLQIDGEGGTDETGDGDKLALVVIGVTPEAVPVPTPGVVAPLPQFVAFPPGPELIDVDDDTFKC